LSAAAPLLVVEDLHVRYGHITAVRGVTFAVGAGEVVGVVGANGAGKTTTVAAITGLVRPAAGSIAFDGAELRGRSPERIARGGISLVPEGRRIFQSLTVEENLRIGATARGSRDLQDALDRELGRFPVLARFRSRTAGNLSGGEQQQLAIARALMAAPRLLVLDEPSLGLAPQMVELVFDTLAALREEGRTILLVEQNARQTVDLADRCLVFRQGVIAAELTSADDADAALEDAYLGGVA
jgi:branched-chain amino acid transport system ATP-binding protein